MTLKHISHGNKVWMPVNHENKFQRMNMNMMMMKKDTYIRALPLLEQDLLNLLIQH